MLHSTSPLIAAGIFGSIAMLAWGAAALFPLLLHLWNRNQHREAPWAAMEFLLAAVEERSRRMRLEQILLLLLRMSIPIMLALALADPLWQLLPTMGSSLGSRAPQHHLFVVDLSYSMGYLVDGRSRIDQAKQVIGEIIEQSPQGDGFTLVAMASPSKSVIRVPAFSSDDALAELATLNLQDNVADLASALDLTQQTIESVKADFPRLTKHRVYFLSDMGATTWDATRLPAVKSRIGEIEKLSDIVTVNLGIGNPRNVGIASVRRSQPIVTPQSTVTWQVNLADHTENASRTPGSYEVVMTVDGKLAGKEPVTFDGQTTATSFQYQFGSRGQHAVQFEVKPLQSAQDSLADGLLVDNRYQEVVSVRETYKLLCVEGKSGTARNVALALAPTDDKSIDVRTIPDHRLKETDLSAYDIVFFCNAGRFTAQRGSQIRDYLKRGRSVVMFLGDLSSPENHNQMLGGGDGQPPILPAELKELSTYTAHRLAPREYRHPLIQLFRGQERAGLLTTPVWQYVRLGIPTESEARVALEFANGDPAIVEHSVLGGHLTLVAMAPSDKSVARQGGQLTPWTAWSSWPSFLPMIQEMLSFAVESQNENRNLLVGDTIASTLPNSTGSQFVTIEKPDATQRRIPVQDDVGTANWYLDETDTGGFYSATIPGVTTAETFAVNLNDSAEGQLQQIAISDLPSQFQQNSITAATSDSSEVNLSTTPLFRTILGLLLALLMTESFVAWYLGNAKS